MSRFFHLLPCQVLRGSDAGTVLSRAELEIIRASRLLGVATIYDRT